MHDIRPYLPELFSNPGSLLYIGARIDAHSWLDELVEAGHNITILEVWFPNILGLASHPARFDIIHDDVRDLDKITGIDTFDYIVWWHGPEHLAEPEIEPTLQMLESKCNRTLALACPYGIYPQGAHAGNPYEIHQTTLYVAFFEALGYSVATDGMPDQPGSEIVAWKQFND